MPFSRRIILIFAFLIFLFNLCFAETTTEASSKEAALDFKEDFTIELKNSNNGEIKVIHKDNGATEVVGHVLFSTTNVNPNGYTASQWILSSEVAATSVNAIHIKVADPKTIFSLLPVEFADELKNYRSYFSPDSSIYTDIHAGEDIFGGGAAPYIGNKVLVNGKDISGPLKENDVLSIIVSHPIPWPKSIVFENRKGGNIYISYPNEESKQIGEVLKPIAGVGRFEGTYYLPPGRIRANHAGVIDVSVSPRWQVGGFQIIPEKHSKSPEMSGALVSTQWMIVRLKDDTGEGKPPLFKYFLRPQYNEQDIYSKDWEAKFLKRFLVEAKLKDGNGWSALPVFGLRRDEDLPKDAYNYLKDVEQIRILFPDVP
ncbi:hypothetical protein HZC34_07090 [Candidatus Saganbacteria bacterium]|nr:hypothetical protein [Candidatus Saganbacteria bacterium]